MDGFEILVVDDEPKITEVLYSFLQSKGCTVYTAQNAEQAFAIFNKRNISFVLLDLMLPGMSGEEICAKIRQKSGVPIIMLTAKSEEEDQLRGLNTGADDYITKPFSLKTLWARIEAVIRRIGQAAEPSYSIAVFNDGDLTINFSAHEIKKAHKVVSATPNEFKILSSMVKFPKKVFTRDELIEITFGMDYAGYGRTIDSHIKNLRKKIETDPKNPVYIKTVHGVGYTFGGV